MLLLLYLNYFKNDTFRLYLLNINITEDLYKMIFFVDNKPNKQ